MDMRIPGLKIKIMLESNPLKSRIIVPRLAVATARFPDLECAQGARSLHQSSPGSQAAEPARQPG